MTSKIQSDEKPIILIICNYYLPGYKAGGGLRTLVNMVEQLKDKFDFRVITGDRDADGVRYTDVKINDWNVVDNTQVFYLPKDKVRISKLRKLILKVKPQAIYLNSVFSILTVSTLTLKKLRLMPEIKIILAPEGELSDGALQLKANKKKAFIRFAKSVNLYDKLIWKVTAEPEKKEAIRFRGGAEEEIFIAPNMMPRVLYEEYRQESKPKKKSGEAKMVFLSRYGRKKNFKWFIDNLAEAEGKLEIDVFGPLEDKIYWDETQESIDKLPSNIKVNYKGHVSHEKVAETIFDYHFFLLPTLGENFGHVFIEALAAGCPLIISDRTPWTELENKQIGWDLPLEDFSSWQRIINDCIALDEISYNSLSTNARAFACHWLADPKIQESTLKVLQHALKEH